MKTEIAKMFNENFKYEVNQQLRHRGDSKGYSADMGLLVLHRLMYESCDDDGNKTYARYYVCRLVKFSGSGETAQFQEKELMTIEDYERQRMKDEADRNRMRNEVRQIQKEVYSAFGVSEEDYLKLKDENGKLIEDKKFRLSGFSLADNVPKITVREVLQSLDRKIDNPSKELTSKDQFEIIKP